MSEPSGGLRRCKCGNLFPTNRNQLYCSPVCKTTNSGIETICETCGSTFIKTNRHRKNRRFCSVQCKYIGNQRRIKKICEMCKKEFQVPVFKNKQFFCSHQCATEKRKQGRIKVICGGCGAAFLVPPSQAKGRAKVNKINFCSVSCKKNYEKPSIELITELHKEGLTNKGIADKAGFHPDTINRYLKKLSLRSNGLGHILETKQEDNKVIAFCILCNCWKDITNFGLHKTCRNCRYTKEREKWLNAVNSDIGLYLQHKLGSVRSRAKKRNIECDLDVPFLLDIYDFTQGCCVYTREKLGIYFGKGRVPNACSIDRLGNEEGYLKTNVLLCTWKANSMKSDLSLDDMLIYMPYFYFQAMMCPWIQNKHIRETKTLLNDERLRG